MIKRHNLIDQSFPDRRGQLFGRRRDLAYLLNRARSKGVTAVCARAQMGKTWLLQEAGRTLTEHGFLVGYKDSQGEGADLLLRAVADLYMRWLSDSDSLQQAAIMWKQQKGRFLTGTAKTLGVLLEKVGMVTPLAKVLNELVHGVVGAEETFRSGGLELKPLQFEQARDLINDVVRVSGKRVVLVLDGWDNSPTARLEAAAINTAVRAMEQWPKAHIFLGLRAEGEAMARMEELQEGFPGTVDIYRLPALHLDEANEKKRLLTELRRVVAATRVVPDHQLLSWIDGYPGVIDRWKRNAHVKNSGELEDLAEQAQHYLYNEFNTLLRSLDNHARILALRLSLLPTADADYWKAIRHILLCGVEEELLDELKLKGVLERGDPPSYGHDKRREAARDWFFRNFEVTSKNELKHVVHVCAASIKRLERCEIYYAATLRLTASAIRQHKLTEECEALTALASTLFGDVLPYQDLLGYTKILERQHCALLAMGLLNVLNYAEKQKDLRSRDLLLEELRALATRYPDDVNVRQWLATGVINTLNAAKGENDVGRRDLLLYELRELAHRYPDDGTARERLATGLFFALNQAKEEGKLSRRDSILMELRELSTSFRKDAVVRERLAVALFNTLCDLKEEGDLSGRDRLLQEMRELAAFDPSDAAVRERLAKGLLRVLNDAKEENSLSYRDSLLTELRELAERWPDDDAVRERFCKALLYVFNDAKEEHDLCRRDQLLGELRSLACRCDKSDVVREQLAKALFNCFNHAREEGNQPRCGALLEELRALAIEFPDDAAVREQFAKGLHNSLNYASEDHDMSRCEVLLVELRDLTCRNPEDPLVHDLFLLAEATANGDSREE